MKYLYYNIYELSKKVFYPYVNFVVIVIKYASSYLGNSVFKYNLHNNYYDYLWHNQIQTTVKKFFFFACWSPNINGVIALVFPKPFPTTWSLWQPVEANAYWIIRMFTRIWSSHLSYLAVIHKKLKNSTSGFVCMFQYEI